MTTQNIMFREVAVKSIKIKKIMKPTRYNTVLVADLGIDDKKVRHEIRRTLDGKVYICHYGTVWNVYANSVMVKQFKTAIEVEDYVEHSRDDRDVVYTIQEVENSLLDYTCMDQM